MFNSTSYRGGDVTNNTTLKINACSGGIYKTYKESWFQGFNLKSQLAKDLFNNCAFSDIRTGEFQHQYSSFSNEDLGNNYNRPYHEKEEIIILQMVICGDMEVIAELIKKEDFDKYFEEMKIIE